MYLEKLELQGFKSFVQKTTLEFPQPRGAARRGIAAIVGPNGSGKSNLSDAIRWVMGEQSMKTLRSKKSEDVIFSGTDKRARVGLAEVSLYLNNEDHKAPVDYSEVVITRRLYRSGESEYLLNRQSVRLQDIALLLAQANFGQKTYSIIGQGMVDAFLAASPLERKEFFDEAAGTRHLQIKREEAVRKLTQAEENLHEADVLIQEITPRLRSLVRQVKRLERRDEVATELRQLQERYYGAVMKEINSEIGSEQSKLDACSKSRISAEKILQEREEKFKAMEKSSSAAERFKALNQEHRNIWESKNKIASQILKIKTELSNLASPKLKTDFSAGQLLPHIIELESALNELANLIDKQEIIAKGDVMAATAKLKDQLNSLKSIIKGDNKDEQSQHVIEETLAQLLKDEKNIEEKLNEVERAIAEFQHAEEEKNKTLFVLQKSIQTQQQEVTLLVSAENEHKVILARLDANHESLKAIIKEELGERVLPPALPLSSSERETAKKSIDQLKIQLGHIGSIDPETVEEYRTTKERNEFLTSQSEDLKKSIHDLRKIIAELDETITRQFNESFQKINHQFEHFFKILFGGGSAKLVRIVEELMPPPINESDEENENIDEEETRSAKKKSERMGIEIHATPPGKRLKSINMLSGGERALTSLALICAIIANNPSPFVVLDEVDAALDEANSSRLAEIVDQLSHHTQFIAITHNRAMMHQSNILYGVTMSDDGASKVLSLKLEDIEKK